MLAYSNFQTPNEHFLSDFVFLICSSSSVCLFFSLPICWASFILCIPLTPALSVFLFLLCSIVLSYSCAPLLCPSVLNPLTSPVNLRCMSVKADLSTSPVWHHACVSVYVGVTRRRVRITGPEYCCVVKTVRCVSNVV